MPYPSASTRPAWSCLIGFIFVAATLAAEPTTGSDTVVSRPSLRVHYGETLELPAPTRARYTVSGEEPARIDGTLRALGDVTLVCAGGFALGPAGVIEAERLVVISERDSTIELRGRIVAREVVIQSREGLVRVSGAITARTPEGDGGSIRILGRLVALEKTAVLDADGERIGGTILIGGDYQGANPAVANAARTGVAAGARLTANALSSGNGGRIIVWADELTRFHGAIAARGGATSGNGGFVEVSGRGHLEFRGPVDLLAPAGRTGELLLDPDDLIIAAASPDLNGDEVRGDDVVGNISATAYPGTVSVITAGEVANLLASANLSLAATNSITVNAAVTWSTTRTLTLTTTGTGSNIAINAALTNSGAGAVTLTSGGSIIVGANITTAGVATLDAVSQTFYAAGTVSAANFHLRGSGNVGNASAPLATNTNFLLLAKSAGDTFVREADQIYLQGSTAGALSVESLAGGIEDGNDPLAVGGVASFTTPMTNPSANVIFFANGNRFCDLVHVRAGGRFDLWTAGGVALGRVQAGGTVKVRFGVNSSGKVLDLTAASLVGSAIEFTGGGGTDKIVGLAGPLTWTSASAGTNGTATWNYVEQIENTNLLGNAGFETVVSVDGSPPGVAGQWFADANEIVTAQNGITPSEGTRMLRLVHTSPGNTQDGSSSDTMQIIDVSTAASQIAAGNFYAAFSARVNRVAGNSQTDTQFMLSLRAYSGSLSSHDFADSPVAAKSVTLISDSDPSTWQTLGTALTLPAGTTYVVAVVSAVENVTDNAHSGIEFDGHYADDAKFHLGTGETQPVTLNALGDVAQTAAASKLHATSSLPLPVTYSVVSGPATVSGNTLSLTGAGSITVAASQAGTGFIAPATAQRTFTSVPTAQVLYFTNFSNFTTGEFVGLDGWTGTHTSGAGSGVYTNFSNPTGFVGFEGVSGSLLTVRRPISFNPASGTYPQVNFSVDLSVVDSTNGRADSFVFRFVNLAGETLSSITFRNSSQTVTFSTPTGVGAMLTDLRLVNGRLTTLRVALNLGTNRWSAWLGDEVLFADQVINSLGFARTLREVAVDWAIGSSGNPGDNYVTLNRYLLSQDKGFQTLTFTPPADLFNLSTTPILLSATATSGLPVVYSIVSGPATISGSNLTLTGTGTVVIRASQPGNASYLAAPPVDRTITVVPAGFQTGAAASSRPVLITETGAWTAATSAPWIQLPVTSGTGQRLIDVSFAANETGADRSATLVIGGTTYNITQRAAGSGLRELWVAGSDLYGELGVGQAAVPRRTPTLVAAGMKSAAPTAGSAYFLGEDGTLWGTGENSSGQLGFGDTATRTSLHPIATRVLQIAPQPDNNSILFLTDDGTLWAAGGTLDSLAALPEATRSPTPIATGVAQVSYGNLFAAYVKTDGTLWTSGVNAGGTLGDGTTVSRSSFAQIATGVASVSCGGGHLAFVKTDGSLWTVGSNSFGQLGTGNTTNRSVAGQIATDVATVSAGATHTAFVKTDGTLWVFGFNGNGQLGLGDTTHRLTPTLCGSGFAKVYCGNNAVFAIKSGSAPALWVAGVNLHGSLGAGDAAPTSNWQTLTAHPTLTAVREVTQAAARTLFTLPDGRVVAAGYAGGDPDSWGGRTHQNSVNDGTADYRTLLTPARDGIAAVQSRTSGGATTFLTLFLRNDGVLFGSGVASWGQFGDGQQYSPRRLPYQIATGVRSFALGGYHALYLKDDNTLWGMGWNSAGSLGTGNTTHQFSPVQLSTGVAQVYAGEGHTVLLKTDGTLWTVGQNALGNLGDGSTTNRTTPIQVASGVVSASTFLHHTLFVKTDGSLWGFGYNSQGQLGDNSTTNRTSPILITTGVAAAWAGGLHSLFLKTDGTLWGMGWNTHGQLGDGTTTRRLVPVQIATNVASASASHFHSLFRKTDGTVWAVGRNHYGQLGDGTVESRATPVQIAANAVAVSAGDTNSFVIGTDQVALTTRPAVLTPPADVTVAAGGDASLSILASGNAAPSYQWFKDGLLLPGETSSSLAIDNASVADTGAYTVRVSNASGTLFATPATITVATGFDAWRLANFSANEFSNVTVSGPLVVGPDGLSNLVRYALGLDATGQPTAHIPATSTLNDDWTYTYTRATDRPDLTYVVEVSTDLVNWTSNGVTHEQVSYTAMTQTWRARYPMAQAPNLFFRLKVVRN